jgi:hypothetical protein
MHVRLAIKKNLYLTKGTLVKRLVWFLSILEIRSLMGLAPQVQFVVMLQTYFYFF